MSKKSLMIWSTMDNQLDKTLCVAFPKLYKHRDGHVNDTCMAWGFTCGNGWFLILWELSEQLEDMGCVASQVKEKFGGLRFYLADCPEDVEQKVSRLLADAEKRAIKTCERCGDPGEKRDRRWIRTLCDRCDGNN